MTYLLRLGVALSVAAVLTDPTLVAQSQPDTNALKKEIDELRQAQAALRQDLEEIKALLRGRVPEPHDIAVSVGDAPARGDRNAALTLIEFSDFQCPFCARHARQTMPRLEAEYIKTGKLRYVFRNFPIQSLHPQAFRAHEAAACANDQGKYWEIHSRFFANPSALAEPQLATHAEALGLDMVLFRSCLDGHRHAAAIRRDITDAQVAGLNSTPSFVIGVTNPNDSSIKAVRVIRGAQPFERFKEALDSVLAEAR